MRTVLLVLALCVPAPVLAQAQTPKGSRPLFKPMFTAALMFGMSRSSDPTHTMPSVALTWGSRLIDRRVSIGFALGPSFSVYTERMEAGGGIKANLGLDLMVPVIFGTSGHGVSLAYVYSNKYLNLRGQSSHGIKIGLTVWLLHPG